MTEQTKIIAFFLAGFILPSLLAPPARAGSGSSGGPNPITTIRVADGLERPLLVVAPPEDFERVFVVEMPGRIRIVKNGELLPTPFLDMDEFVYDASGFDPRGLLGLAFHPDYASNGEFFVSFINNLGNSVIARARVSSDPDLADAGSLAEVLSLVQPGIDHNGGMIAFGPHDSYLYVGFGDGRGPNDIANRAQNPGTWHGKILRIDVDGGAPYAIPPDNPFVGPGNPRDEIWASGLRSPWRFSFDRLTGDLYIADVGQMTREEINYQPGTSPGGENYGWRCKEGIVCSGLGGCDCVSSTITDPIHDYGRSSGCSVTGGYVYRGVDIPELFGAYFYADWCSRRIWTFRVDGGVMVDFQERTADLIPDAGPQIGFIASFGEDARSELYLCDWMDGEVYKIVPRRPVITSISPGTVQAFEGGTITLSGTRFQEVTEVCSGGVAVEDFTVVSDFRLTYVAPEATRLGSTSVTVTSPDGTSTEATFESVATDPPRISVPATTPSGVDLEWRFGGLASIPSFLLVSLDPDTQPVDGFDVLTSPTILDRIFLSPAGIGRFERRIPGPANGITFHSQVVLRRFGEPLAGASNVAETSIDL